MTKSSIFNNLNLRKKADCNFRGDLLENHFRHLKLYSNPPSTVYSKHFLGPLYGKNNRELSFKSRSSKQYYFVEINQDPKIEKWIKFLEKEKESLSRKKTYLFEIMLEQWMMSEYAIRHSISSKSLHSQHSSLHQLLKFNAPSAWWNVIALGQENALVSKIWVLLNAYL